MANWLQLKSPGRLEGYDNTSQYHASWDDLKAPATSLKAGNVSPTTNTTFGWLEFAHNSDEFVFSILQLPHKWKEGSTLKPHLHWMKTTAAEGLVEWQLEYRWSAITEVLDADWTTLASSTPATADDNLQYQHIITPFGEINAEGKTLSDMLICKITRLGTSYSGAGATHYTAAAALIEFDIHYEIDSLGSEEEFTK